MLIEALGALFCDPRIQAEKSPVRNARTGRYKGKSPPTQTTAGATMPSLRLAVDGAVFHYERYLLQGGDVIERVAGDGDDIGGISGLECADLILPA